VHDDYRQRVVSVFLPVAVAQHLHSGFDFDQPSFGWRQRNSPWKKKTGKGLNMSATQTASGHKFSGYSLRSSHVLILNGYER